MVPVATVIAGLVEDTDVTVPKPPSLTYVLMSDILKFLVAPSEAASDPITISESKGSTGGYAIISFILAIFLFVFNVPCLHIYDRVNAIFLNNIKLMRLNPKP